MAHLGLGLTTLGIVGVVSFETENILAMKPGADGGNLRLCRCDSKRYSPVQGPNFTENRAVFSLLDDGGKPYGEIVSAKRFYPVRQMPTTEAGIKTMGVSQLYVSLGDETAGWRHRRAHLVEAIGDADLDRRAGDDGRRRRVVAGSQAADRRAIAAAAARRRQSRSGGGMKRSMLFVCWAAGFRPLAARGRPCRAARRGAGRSCFGSEGACALGRVALHGLPEPVDRHFRRRTGARPARSGARTADGRG